MEVWKKIEAANFLLHNFLFLIPNLISENVTGDWLNIS
jgi:hypothetical protein